MQVSTRVKSNIMAKVTENSVRSLERRLQEGLTLWEVFLLVCWSCCLFLRKFSCRAAAWVVEQLVRSLKDRGGLGDENLDPEPEGESTAEGVVTFVTLDDVGRGSIVVICGWSDRDT